MNHYETIFIVKPTLTPEEIEAQVEKTKETIEKNGGDILAIDEIGMRKLAYPIKKHERGYYSVIYYLAPGEAIAEIEYQLRYNEDILKFMSVKYRNKREIAQFEKMASKASKVFKDPLAKEENKEEPKEEAKEEA